MYIDRLLLSQVTNREDLYLTVGIYDDDTGIPIDLDRATTSSLISPYTGSAWTVTDGAIVTTSASTFTIPVFPIINQLSSLSITVGLGLGILAGDVVKIADTATGANFVTGYVLSYSPTTGALTAQIGMTMEFEIRYSGPRNLNIDDYSAFFYVGQVLTSPPLVSAALGTGISIIDLGMILIRIPESTMRQFERRSYQAALTMFDGYDTRQIFVAELPIGYGGVTT